jgi:hypothetical protein
MDTPQFESLSSSLEMMAALEPILSAVTLYRSRLIEEGFSSEAAEAMTMEFHQMLILKGMA